MTYLKKLAEEIMRRFEGGDPSNDRDIDNREIYELIGKTINKLLKMEYLNVHLPQGDYVPPQASIAEFSNVVVQPYGEETFTYIESRFDDIGFALDYWITPDGQGWFTDENQNGEVDIEDNVWAISGTPITMVVSELSYNNYEIRVNGISFPEGKTATDLSDFMGSVPETGYIQFTGFTEQTPSVFLGGGISNLVVGADYILFNYNVTLATGNAVYEDLKQRALDTHSLLGYFGSQTFSDVILNVIKNEYQVLSVASRSFVKLPIQPINLPKGMGVWRVYNPITPFVSYIPLSSAQHDMYGNVTHTGLSSALGFLTAFEYFNHDTLVFNKPVSQMPSSVNIQLVVTRIKDDNGNYDEFGLLQIPADMEQQVIAEVLQLLGSSRPEDLITNQNEAR